MIGRRFHNIFNFFILLLGDKMKMFIKIIKKICIGMITIYSFNVLFGLLNIIIPINLFTIAVSTFLGIPGNFALVLLKIVI